MAKSQMNRLKTKDKNYTAQTGQKHNIMMTLPIATLEKKNPFNSLRQN